MAKKKETETKAEEEQVTAGGRRICPDCQLQFRLKELFDQHRSAGCKPAKQNGPTWSDKNIEKTPEEQAAAQPAQ